METKNGASENSETKQNQPHNHHFIPQFYLRHFVTKDTQGDKKKEKIYVIDKQHQRFEDEPRLIKHVGSENDYNTFWIDENHEDCASFERQLCTIEKRQAKLLERIKTEKSIKNIEKRELASLVAWMYGRVPIKKRIGKAIYDEMRYQLLDPYGVGNSVLLSGIKPPIYIDRTRENNILLEFIYFEPRKKVFLDVLETFQYMLISIPKESKKFFITSDNPVTIACKKELSARYFAFVFFHPDKEKHLELRMIPNYADFKNKSFNLFLPIDRKFGLWLHRNKAAEDRIRWDADDNLIDFLNSHTIASADKEIYAPEITDELKVLVKSYWIKQNTFVIDTTQYTQDTCDFFMRNVCNIKGNYTPEDLAREIKDKRLFYSMRVFPGRKDIVFFTADEPIPSTHECVLLEGNRKNWSKWLESHKLLVLFAPFQTNGIGSHGRKWISDKEDFHVNLIFYCDKILPFSQIAAYTACQLLARETMQTERFKIKWPNDVMVEDFDGWQNFKKIGGCLTAVRDEGTRYWTTVGIGINYNLEDFSNIDQPTASVKSFLNSFPGTHGLYRESDFTEDELHQSVQDFSNLFSKNLALIQYKGSAAFYDKEDPFFRFGSQNHWLYFGQKVTVFDEDRNKQLTGRFEKLTDDGALQLACDDGHTEVIRNGTGLKLA